MGLFNFIGSLLGGNSAKKASRKAEAAQLQFLQRALDESMGQRTLDRENFAPFQEAGVDALGGQRGLIGLDGPEAQAAAIAQLQGSPLFQSLYRTGEEAVLQNASATGGLRGGNTQRGLADFGADTLAQVIQQQLAQLGGLSGQGLQAAGGASGAGINSTNLIANLLGQQGQVRAGGLLTRGGISSGMWNNAGAFLDDSVNAIFKAIELPF